MLLSSGTPLSYSRQRMLSAIDTILDSLIAFRILFPLMKKVNLLPSRLYILQPSPSTIISGSKNMSLKGLRNVLYIWSILSLFLTYHYLTLVPMLRSQSLLVNFPLSDIFCSQTSQTLFPNYCCLFPILVL